MGSNLENLGFLYIGPLFIIKSDVEAGKKENNQGQKYEKFTEIAKYLVQYIEKLLHEFHIKCSATT